MKLLLLTALLTSTTNAHLQIRVWPHGLHQPSFSTRLICPGGDHRCRELARHRPSETRPVAKDRVCASIWGGPARARIDGRWQGQKIHATFGRNNSCQIRRWQRLAFLFKKK